MTKIGFLGAGQMATALAMGWKNAGLLNAGSLAADPSDMARNTFTNKTGLQATSHNVDVPQDCKMLLLAVKPQMMAAVLAEIAPHMTPDHLVISIAAGVTLARLAAALPVGTRIARVMPNTPALVGASATGFALNQHATKADAVLVSMLFKAVGVALHVTESQLDAVTGLSGSGPAYVFVMMEALADGGVRMGLPRETALALAAQTVLGAATMLLQTGQHPAQLKDAVASPGGTTIAGLHALEQGGFRAAIMDAVQAATERAMELGAK
jgi:pyrroline-5-carboxylate reductase